jgi:1-acyl-sn-glycerol-3-phosphate acyltransferase
MWKTICKLILKMIGWKTLNGIVPSQKAIIIGVPHTSGWDFVLSYLFYTSVGGVANTMIKKEFFFWPVGPILKKMGGIPIDRDRGASITKQIIHEMNSRVVMHLAITPEGTRNLTKKWKAGFHTIAKATGATIFLGIFDFGRKEIGWIKPFELTDDAEADIRRMKAFYREYGAIARHPEKFTAED